MNICFIEDTHLHGGTQIWVTEANRYFLEHGQEVTILAPENSWIADKCTDTGARIVTYNWQDVIKKDSKNIEIWTEALGNCDVAVCTVHPPREGFHCSVFAAECIKRSSLRTHLIPKTGTIVPEYLREFYLPDPEINSSVIAITNFTRRSLLETYKLPVDRVKLIYQGTDIHSLVSTPEGRANALQRYPIPEGSAPVLGCVGSFEHRKGQSVLFDAIALLASGSLPDVHLLMVGDGPDEKMLKEKMDIMNLTGNISFFPFTKEPKYIYERLDITVLSSLYKEGLPNVLLESMAMSVPVVSSNLAGVPEIVTDGKTGFMTEPGNSRQIADAVLKLWFDRKLYSEASQNARKLMEKKFDKQIQFERFIEYFKLLC